MTPSKTVEEICQGIERYQLMSSKELAALRARWFRPNRKEAADPEQFRRWLVINQYLTEFVAKVLSGRKADQLVLNQYRLVDQLISGPMAGSYVAIDPLDRQVAIEVLSAQSAADRNVLAGFEQAARKAMAVQHPNVGRILDVGEAHGFHFLVKEFYKGQTLDEILSRRRTLPYAQAARLITLALAGVEALHSHGVPAGDLTANCLQLVTVGKESQRTVKVLHAGVKRKLFDETAIGRSIAISMGIPDELKLAESYTFQVADAGVPNPAQDIFRLGCLLYRCITGTAPYSEQEMSAASRPSKPIRNVVQDLPEMLAQIIDDMISPDAASRPKKAGQVAKALRVFLAADEETREPKAEENLAIPKERAASTPADVAPEVDVEEDEDEDDRPVASRPGTPMPDTAWGKVLAVWEDVKPETRDLLFFAGGALGVLLLILISQVLFGLSFIYVAGLATGAAASYFVEMFLRWRRAKNNAPEVQ